MSDNEKKATPLISNNRVYDTLKYIAQIFLPAAGTLYFALAQTWGWSNGTEVVGTVVSVDTFLGILLQISTMQYNTGAKYDGAVHIYDQPDKKTYSLDLHDDIEDLDNKTEVILKVKKV